MNKQDLERQKLEEEERKRQAADEVTKRIEELKKRKNYHDTDEDDGYHD